MALIYVKRRKDPIKISNQRAQAVKDAKFGNGDTPKAENDEFLDLGIWAGQFGEIVQIELDEVVSVKAVDTTELDRQKQIEQDEAEMRAMSKEDLANRHLRMFALWKWFGWSHMQEKEAPQEAQDFMYKKLLSFFKKNPSAIYPPNELSDAFKSHFFGVKKSTEAD